MKNILLNYFETVYSLETFLKECRLKLKSAQDELKLKEIIKNLSKIVICFDFKLNGPFKSYIDTRYSYAQILYLCYIKINESDDIQIFENHMMRAKKKPNSPNYVQINDILLKLPEPELERKLLSFENLSLSYFLSTKSNQDDGFYWKELHNLVGSSIMKHILLYSYIFRRLDTSVSYVQVSGAWFNKMQKQLIAKKLDLDEKSIKKKALQHNKNSQQQQQPLKAITSQINNQHPTQQSTPPQKSTPLNKIFEKRIEEITAEMDSKSSVNSQLKKIGSKTLNRTSMLYDRKLNNKISAKYIYSNKNLDPNSNDTAIQIMNQFILKDIDFSPLNDDNCIKEMRSQLSEVIKLFTIKFRTCPFNIFLHDNCIRQNKNSPNNDKENQSEEINSKKRKRSDNEKIIENTKSDNLNNSIDKKSVFKFIRRCLMFIFDYQDKVNKKNDNTCPLIGGKDNADKLIQKLKNMVNGLKYDGFIINNLLQNIKLSRISYLKPIKCDKFKTLIILHLLRWLFEDVIIIILKAHFYITDTSKTNSELFYYLKKTWKSIVFSQLSDPISKNYRKLYNLEKIKETDAITYCSSYQSNGICLGRLLPKNVNNECRIISGCRLYNPCTKKSYSMNYKFITLNACLNWLIENDKSLTGFACNGQLDMYRSYVKFLNLNSLHRSLNSDPIKKWNFMKFDIEKCFDSIDSKQIMDYVNELFYKKLGYDYVFTILRSIKLKYDLDRKQLKTRYDYINLRHRHHEKGIQFIIIIKLLGQKSNLIIFSGFLYGISDYIHLIEETERKKHSINNRDCVIYVPWYIYDRSISFKNLRDLLKKCLQHVLIKIHGDIYERMSGILQGSVCSRNLCDLYLGRIEKKLFSYENDDCKMRLNRADDLILRVVDDYLVISCNYDKLIQIKDLIKLEAKFNDAKTVLYKWTPQMTEKQKISEIIDLAISDDEDDDDEKIETDEVVYKIDFLSNCSHSYFSWCGFNIDVNTLDVYFNYDKYFDESSLKNRLNLTSDYRYPFIFFNIKFLRLFAYNAGSIIVTNSSTNSLQAIIRNFVDFFALSSIRFFILFKLMPLDLVQNHKLQIKLFNNLCYHLNNRLPKKLRDEFLIYFYSTLNLIKFVCFRTYSILLAKFNQSRHNRLLKLINRNLIKLDFIRCIKSNQNEYFSQINTLIEQQVVKFYNCKLC